MQSFRLLRILKERRGEREARGSCISGPENQYHIKLVVYGNGSGCFMSTIAAARSSPMPFTIGSYVCVLRLLLSRTRLNAHIITPNKVQRETKMLRKMNKAKSRWRLCEFFRWLQSPEKFICIFYKLSII